MKKLVLLNGPPRCGKDTVGQMLVERLPGYRVDKFARKLKDLCHCLYGICGLPHSHYELCKDEPRAEFLGLSPRQVYIGLSERYFKPMHGLDVFGRMLLEDYRSFDGPGLIITDCGFNDEVPPMIEHFGAASTLLVRLRRDGRDFSGDSRGYLLLDHMVQTLDLYNPEGLPALSHGVETYLLPLVRS